MPAAEIGRKTVAFFLPTSVPNIGTLVLLGVGLATGVLPGHVSAALTLIPAAAAAGAIAATLALARLSRRIEARTAARPGRSHAARLAPAFRAIADGVEEALRVLRQHNPLLLAGLLGYMVFDILVLWASFRALGSTPELTHRLDRVPDRPARQPAPDSRRDRWRRARADRSAGRLRLAGCNGDRRRAPVPRGRALHSGRPRATRVDPASYAAPAGGRRDRALPTRRGRPDHRSRRRGCEACRLSP
jgi:hypothetical protein